MVSCFLFILVLNKLELYYYLKNKIKQKIFFGMGTNFIGECPVGGQSFS